jgi:protein-S-isoprenylcysteine O-methyltransferase Ste14
MYSGGIIFAYGWAFVVHGWLTLVYATVLLIFFEIKARREEQWLIERFPEYPDYRRRVRMLIPFIH